MDRTDIGSPGTTGDVPRNKRIGIIGRTQLEPEDQVILKSIGRMLVRLNHVIVLTNTKGTSETIKEGVIEERGEIDTVTKDVIESSDHTLIYPSPQLLEKIEKKYPDIHERKDVSLITPAELPLWEAAIQTLVKEAAHRPMAITPLSDFSKED